MHNEGKCLVSLSSLWLIHVHEILFCHQHLEILKTFYKTFWRPWPNDQTLFVNIWSLLAKQNALELGLAAKYCSLNNFCLRQQRMFLNFLNSVCDDVQTLMNKLIPNVWQTMLDCLPGPKCGKLKDNHACNIYVVIHRLPLVNPYDNTWTV